MKKILSYFLCLIMFLASLSACNTEVDYSLFLASTENGISVTDGAFTYYELVLNDKIVGYSISGVPNAEKTINVPESYNKLPVLKIYKKAFFEFSALEEVTLPASVIEIEREAFASCKNLKAVTGAYGVCKIGNFAFSSCSALIDIALYPSLVEIGENAFEYCVSLTEIVLPDGFLSLNAYAFANCCNLEKINIPSSVTTMGAWIFTLCDKVEISCDFPVEPPNWDTYWNYHGYPVIWTKGN